MKQIEDNNLFRNVLKDIQKAKSSKINFIPFSNFERFKNDYFGILKDDYTILTSGSGTGKSKFMFNQYIMQPFNYVTGENNIENLDCKIFYYSLEEHESKVIYNLICSLLFNMGIYVDIRRLKGIPDTDSLTDELMDTLKSLAPYFDKFLKKVSITSFANTPRKIFEKTKSFMLENGKLINGQYIPNNDKLYVIQITDHISKLLPDDKEGITESIDKHSGYYNLILKNTYKCQIVDVQQQTAYSEQLDFNAKGILNEQKLKPTRDGLSHNKNTFTNATFVLGLFAPYRHGIKSYNDYNLKVLKDSYRYLEILKARDGTLTGIDLFFNGITGNFEELPKIMSDENYNIYKDKLDIINSFNNKIKTEDDGLIYDDEL